jgi:valyl-tRNA synthetase
VRRWIKENRGQPLPLSWDGKPTERYPQMQQSRNFANKIWNAARFVLTQGNPTSAQAFEYSQLDLAGKWILARLYDTTVAVTNSIENYDFENAASTLYGFIWGDFCDWFVELSKQKLRDGDTQQIALLTHVLEKTMRLLHPFMPFISEEIWQKLPKSTDAPESVCVASWPTVDELPFDAKAVKREFALLQDIIARTRNLRAEAKLPPSQKLNLQVFALSDDAKRVLASGQNYIVQLANLENIEVLEASAPRPANALSASLSEVEIFLPLEGLIDTERETARLQKEIENLQKELAIVEKKLLNPQFVEKAQPAAVEKVRVKHAEIQSSIEKLSTRLRELS